MDKNIFDIGENMKIISICALMIILIIICLIIDQMNKQIKIIEKKIQWNTEAIDLAGLRPAKEILEENKNNMKIVMVDNFNIENQSHILICSNVTKYYGELIVNFLNKKRKKEDVYHYVLIEDNCNLYETKP